MSAEHPFADLYAKIPRVNCTGRCGRNRNDTCCGPIGCSVIEAQLLEQFDGIRCDWEYHSPGNVIMNLPAEQRMVCPHLGVDGRCIAYDVRPLICRLFGVVEDLRCPWGCKPERLMTKSEVAKLWIEIQRRATRDQKWIEKGNGQ